ncbi:hypothetical protein BV898_17555 [Hypsibius exemplaris]|uniref:39S ribosomal protein L20, mitochondrial n=1 Tax=Hypsibius exemplaris TaxID=2072580 RepID=A0A9X6RMN3_HYPEX|nr:hypothetical protein BV898_17555 [Hypsibius exemplaris]
MRLSLVSLIRAPRNAKVPSKEKLFDRLPIFRITSNFFGRRRNCWSLAMPAAQKGLVRSAWGKKVKGMYSRMLRITRLEAALHPYGQMSYESFAENLAKVNVLLNKRILADFAMLEPRTFKAIVSLAQKKQDMDGETSQKELLTRPYPSDLVLGSNYLKF